MMSSSTSIKHGSKNREILVDKVTGQGEPEAYSVTPNNIPNYTAPQSLFGSAR